MYDLSFHMPMTHKVVFALLNWNINFKKQIYKNKEVRLLFNKDYIEFIFNFNFKFPFIISIPRNNNHETVMKFSHRMPSVYFNISNYVIEITRKKCIFCLFVCMFIYIYTFLSFFLIFLLILKIICLCVWFMWILIHFNLRKKLAQV